MPNNPTSIKTFAENFLVQSPKESSGYIKEMLKDNHGDNMASPTILICGHASRDTRCGILGPILREEFRNFVDQDLMRVRHETGDVASGPHTGRHSNPPLANTAVSLCSHVGGHAFAGNVVIYLPRRWKAEDGKSLSPLAGKGIWYGRVEPKHVWGIMEETVKKGRLIEELLRGVHGIQPWLMEVVPHSRSSVKPLEQNDFYIKSHLAGF